MAGPQPKTTAEQREQVLALVGAGQTYSAVAAEVFGNPDLRGRVERIVRRDRNEPRGAPKLDDLLSQLSREQPPSEDRVEQASWLAQLLPLYGRMLVRRLERDLPVSGRDLLALADLELRLQNQRRLKRLNALAREGR
jgi:hypothetical protein